MSHKTSTILSEQTSPPQIAIQIEEKEYRFTVSIHGKTPSKETADKVKENQEAIAQILRRLIEDYKEKYHFDPSSIISITSFYLLTEKNCYQHQQHCLSQSLAAFVRGVEEGEIQKGEGNLSLLQHAVLSSKSSNEGDMQIPLLPKSWNPNSEDSDGKPTPLEENVRKYYLNHHQNHRTTAEEKDFEELKKAKSLKDIFRCANYLDKQTSVDSALQTIERLVDPRLHLKPEHQKSLLWFQKEFNNEKAVEARLDRLQRQPGSPCAHTKFQDRLHLRWLQALARHLLFFGEAGTKLCDGSHNLKQRSFDEIVQMASEGSLEEYRCKHQQRDLLVKAWDSFIEEYKTARKHLLKPLRETLRNSYLRNLKNIMLSLLPENHVEDEERRVHTTIEQIKKKLLEIDKAEDDLEKGLLEKRFVKKRRRPDRCSIEDWTPWIRQRTPLLLYS